MISRATPTSRTSCASHRCRAARVREPDTATSSSATRSTVSARLFDGGAQLGATSTQAAGDTTFTFGQVGVTPGHTLTLVLDWTATAGTIDTVYTVSSPGGTFHSSNSCSADHQSDTTNAGLRARISGLGY